MPPPSMMPSHAGSAYPGPGGMGKMHSSGGMMHMSGPSGAGGMQANTGIYGGQMYGNQPSAGLFIPYTVIKCSKHLCEQSWLNGVIL